MHMSIIHKYFTLSSHICSTTPMYFLFERNYLFFSHLTKFEIVHTCISVYNVHAYEVLCDNYKYFTFGSHICPFTSMITYVLFV